MSEFLGKVVLMFMVGLQTGKLTWPRTLDKCEICKGENGGVPGNENIVDGITVCDYCHAGMRSVQNYTDATG